MSVRGYHEAITYAFVDPQLQRRWGLKIPVLLLDQVPVCSVRLDQAELLRVLRDRAGAP